MAVADHRFRVMASDAQVLVVEGPAASGDIARRCLDGLEHRWSRFLPSSDITRMNLAEGRPVEVHADTVLLVATMRLAWEQTGGRYDPTLLPTLVGMGHDVARALGSPIPGLADRPTGGIGGVQIDRDASTVTLPPGCTLDPGGIGKGLAADLTVLRLLDAGAGGALVSVGGDLAMLGDAPDLDGWTVVVETGSTAGGDLCTLRVGAGGVATSSTRSRRWVVDGRWQHHVVDPRSADSAPAPSSTDLAAVTVVAGSGWEAEAHSTAAMLEGSTGCIAHLVAHGLSGIAQPVEGAPLCTPDLSFAQSTAMAAVAS